MGSAHSAVAHPLEPSLEIVRVFPKLTQYVVLDAVLAPHLFYEQLGIGDDVELVDPALRSSSHAREQTAVLRNVVRRVPDRLSARIENGPIFRLQDVAERSRARVAARAAVSGQARFQLAVSICALCSLPL